MTARRRAVPTRPARSGPAASERRWLARSGGLLAIALLATACGGGDSGGGGNGAQAGASCNPEEEPVSLTLNWWGSDSRHEYTQELITMFEDKNPGVTVEGTYTGWGDYWDRLATTVAGGDTPDVMQFDFDYVREYADRGALLDLTPYLGEEIDDADLDENLMATGTLEDSLPAIPTGGNALSVVADPQIFAEAGVDLPDDDAWSWEDYVSVATAVSEGTPENVWGTQDKGFNESNLEIFARQRGEDLFTEDGQVAVSPETIAEWWQVSLDAQESGGQPQASVSVETQAAGIDQSLVATNRGAMQWNWTNELPALSSASGRELQLLRFPGETTEEQSGAYLKPSMFWAAGADTECPNVAAELIDFLVNDPDAAALIGADRGLPVNTQLREQVVADLPPADQTSAEFLDRISEDLADPPPLPPRGSGEVGDILTRLNEEVLFGQITPQDAAEQFITEAEGAIA